MAFTSRINGRKLAPLPLRGASPPESEPVTPLRTMLILLTLCVACVGPFLDGTADPHSWRILPTVIAPALMMMLVFALPLDMTMTLVFIGSFVPQTVRNWINMVMNDL